MSEISIRPYRPGDGPTVSDVHLRSVREAALADYTVEQTEAWLPEARDPAWFDGRAADGRLVLVAEHPDLGVVAYADLEPDGHIDHTYCAPEVVGTGVASRLYEALEDHARSTGMTSLHVEASEAARRLFAAKGFVEVRRHDFERGGVAIHNYAMRKQLS